MVKGEDSVVNTSRGALFLLGMALGVGSMARGEDPSPAIAVRLVRPDRLAQSIIDLFRGARVAHPAAALAAWKRASREPNRLGKPLEALIAAVNPSMVRELRTFDEAEADFWINPRDGKLDWGAFLPHDDGTFAALATSMALTGGSSEAPMDGFAVDRLGPTGSALMARAPSALLLGSSRDGLKRALMRSVPARNAETFDGVHWKLDPRALDGATSVASQRLRAVLGGPLRPESGALGLAKTSLVGSMVLTGTRPEAPPTIPPDWLDWAPSSRAAMAFAIAVEPKPQDWDALFAMLDQVERLDPAHRDVAPSRFRLGLLSRIAGVRLDLDILPHLRGISGWAGTNGRDWTSAFLMVHLDNEPSAVRVYEGARPRDVIEGRPLKLTREGKAVVVAWGEGIFEASKEARGNPTLSAGATLRRGWGESSPSLAGGVWPGRIPAPSIEDTPMDVALSDSPPVSWSGAWIDPRRMVVRADWVDLDFTVRKFLNLLPLDPPPDR